MVRAAALYGDLDDRPGQARTLNQLGWVHVLSGNYQAALTSHRQALALARGAGDRLAEADAFSFQGFAHQMTGDYETSATNLATALARYRSLGHRRGEADALNDLGTLQTLTGGLSGRGRQPQAGPGHLPRPGRPALPGLGT